MGALDWGLLAELEDEPRRAVLARTRRRKYRKGDTLFHEGDPGDSLHLLDKGRVAVRVSTPLGDVATLTVLAPGASFGELALVFPDAHRSATVVALEPVETLTLGHRDFVALCRDHRAVEGALLVVLANDVRRLSGQVLDALYLPADKRILRRLVSLLELYPAPSEGPVVVPITQEELATMAGTTRPTVNRVLQELTADGALEVRRARISVMDAERLRRRAR